MARNDKNLQDVYNTLKNEGYTPPVFEDFCKDMENDSNLQDVHNTLKQIGYTPPDFDIFKKDMFGGINAEPTVTTHPETKDAVAEVKQAVAPVANTAVTAASTGGLGRGSARSVLDDYHLRMGDWTPDSAEPLAEQKEQIRRMREANTPEGRKIRRTTEILGGSSATRPMIGAIKPAETSESIEGTESDAAPSATGLKATVAPVPYRLTVKDGKLTTEWMLGDGRTTTSLSDVAKATGENKWAEGFAARMKQNGLDMTKDEDVAIQQSIDSFYDDEKSEPVWKGGVVDEMAQNGLDANNPEHLKWVLQGDIRSVFEYQLEQAKSELKDMESEQMDLALTQYATNKAAGKLNVRGSRMNGHVMSEADKNSRDISLARSAVSQMEYALKHFDQKAKASEKGWFGKLRQGVWDGLTDKNTYSAGLYGLSQMLNRESADTSTERGQKVAQAFLRSRLLEDQAANAGGLYEGARFGGSMIGDPVMWLSGGMGGMAKGGLRALLRKGLARHMEREIAERFLATQLSRGQRFVMGMMEGAAAGSANFATFEGLSNLRQQLYEGGWRDENGGFHEGFSWANVRKATGKGATLGALMGVFGSGIGNVTDLAVKATRNSAGKIALHTTGNAVGFATEGTIFALDGMRHIDTMSDDTFDQFFAEKHGYALETDAEKRTAAREKARAEEKWESLGESLLNLAGMKLGGKVTHMGSMWSEASRNVHELLKKDRRDGRSTTQRIADIMTRSPYDLKITDDEIKELRDHGYTIDNQKASTLFGEGNEWKKIDGQWKVVDGPGGTLESDFGEMADLIADTRLSESLRAKIYYRLSGQMLPLSTITGYTLTKHEDGSATLTTTNANGEPITIRRFDTRAKANKEIPGVERQIELNSVAEGERLLQEKAEKAALNEALNIVAQNNGLSSEDVTDIVTKAISGEKISTSETELIREAQALAKQSIENQETPESVRNMIKESTDIDIDKVLDKPAAKRSAEEKNALEEYISRLYGRSYTPSEPGRPRDMHEDGLYHPATLKVSDRQVFIVKGMIVTNEDGSVNTRASDSVVYYFEPAVGKVRMAAADDFAGVGEVYKSEEKSASLQGEAERYGSGSEQNNDALSAADQPAVDSGRPQVNVEEYDRGYTRGIEFASSLSDQDLDSVISILRGRDRLSEEDSGKLDAYVYEQQSRRLAAQPAPETENEAAGAPSAEPTPSRGPISSAAPTPEDKISVGEIDYAPDDMLRVAIDGKDNGTPAKVLGVEDGSVTIWTSLKLNDSSTKMQTSGGYTTEMPREELDKLVIRDENGEPVDYVSAKEKKQGVMDVSDNSDESDSTSHGNRQVIGTSLSKNEADDLIIRMESDAEEATYIELTPENWIAQFGEGGMVETPVGVVKMGENQFIKLYSRGRAEYFGMIKPTLTDPDVVIEKNAPTEGAERDTKYLFVKTFRKSDGGRIVHFESITVRRDGMEVSVSSHEAEATAIKKEMQNGKILHLNEKLSLDSDGYLTETPTASEGPDLVPTSDNRTEADATGVRQRIYGGGMAHLVSSGLDSEHKDNVTSGNSQIPDGEKEPMPMRKVTKKGKTWDEPEYLAVSPARSHAYIYEEAELTREQADEHVAFMAKEAEKAVKAHENKKPTMKGSIAEFKHEEAAWEEKRSQLQREVDYWNAVKAIQEATTAEEREAARLEQEEAARWEQQKRDMDKRLRDTAEKVKDVPEAVAILENSAPQTIDEVAAWLLSGTKVLWDDVTTEGGRRLKYGVSSHTGLGNGERRKLIGLFASAEKGGVSIDRLAEDAMQEACEEFGVPYDNGEALDALISVISSAHTRGDITNYIVERRMDQAERTWAAAHEEERRQYDNWCYEQFGMSGDEFEAYEEDLAMRTKEALENFDEQDYYSRFADEILNNQRTEDELRRNQETLGGREDAAHGRGYEVLPPTQSAPATGGRAIENEDSRSGAGDRYQSPDKTRTVSETPSGSTGEDGRGLTEPRSNSARPKYDRTVPATREAQRTAISRIIEFAKRVKNRVERAVIAGITKRQAKDFAENGIDVDETWVHSFESSAVAHNKGQHGDPHTEELVGQIAITPEDYARIPEILEAYDQVRKSPNRSRSTGNEVIIYEKDFEDGYIYYLEEKRDKRKSLSFQTMYKKKKGTDSSDGLMPKASPSTPTAPSDNLNSNFDHKVSSSASNKQEKGAESFSREEERRARTPHGDKGGEVFFNELCGFAKKFKDAAPNELPRLQKNLGKWISAQPDAYLVDLNAELLNAAFAEAGLDDPGKEWAIRRCIDKAIPADRMSAIWNIRNKRAAAESSVQTVDGNGEQSVQAAVEAASAQVNTTPTPAQAAAGNYKKGHVTIGDFKITIENPAGSVRRGVDAEGKEWSTTMANAYGEIKGTESVDGDPLDVFLHKDMDSWDGRKVYVVDQTNTDGSFDEHKVMLGFNDKDEAMSAYLANYDKTWADTHPGLRISEVSIDDFKKWVQSSHRKTKPFADYAMVKSKNESSVDDKISAAEKSETGSKIEDFGEKLRGARKDMARDFAESLDNVTEQGLVELPLSKVYKQPNVKKMVDEGSLSEENARLAESIIHGLILAKKRPVLTRRASSRAAMQQWAKETYEGIKLLQAVLSGDREQLESAMAAREAKKRAAVDEANRHIARMREWNPGRTFADITEIPDAIDVIGNVLEGIGHRPGEKVNLPLTMVSLNCTYSGFEVSAPGKQGSLWFGRTFPTLDAAIDAMVLAARLKRGDSDVELPQRFYSVAGVGASERELTGTYTVSWIEGRSARVQGRVFNSKDEAEAFAKKKGGVAKEDYRSTGKYESYAVRVTNPLTGERHVIKEGFKSREEAAEFLENTEDANAAAVEAINKELGTQSRKRENYYISPAYNRRKNTREFHVVENDKNIRYPIIKTFDKREEAEKWLAENKSRLEQERKERRESVRKRVYFDDGVAHRTGADRRGGRDATPQMFEDAFGFRGVQFGNWTNDADRQAALNQAYDAFMDMAEVLGLSPRAMSLDGELGLAFGARGGGRALAHYEPTEVVINLTKTQGAGSLAHEWWHAIDNYLSRHNGVPQGFASHGNGMDSEGGTVAHTVKSAVDALMKALRVMPYMKRSEALGDYWGRPTEVTARLFAEWINHRLASNEIVNPFLSRGVNEATKEMVQRLNHAMYASNERREADREGREPVIMSLEEYSKLPESLDGHPYPTAEEVKSLDRELSALFDSLVEREHESGSMAEEPRRRYGSRSARAVYDDSMPSLFDDIDDNSRRADMANDAIDRFAESYTGLLDEIEEIESTHSESAMHPEQSEKLEYLYGRIAEEQGRLEDTLRDFYSENLDTADVDATVHDMMARVRGEVEIRRRRVRLGDLMDRTPAKEIIEASNDTGVFNEQPSEREMETAGSDVVRYSAIGHLPDHSKGEFTMVERQFNISGALSLSGSTRIESRDDVAWLFRSLESMAVEHTFCVAVKDGKARVIHTGMGSPFNSIVDHVAFRAAFDAWQPDKIWFVHNHPSGTMRPSPQDVNSLRTIERMFEGQCEVGALIMDARSGRYCEFDSDNSSESYERPRSGEETAYKVMSFDRLDEKDQYPENLEKMNNSEAVARFVTRQRLGSGKKVGFMVLDSQLDVKANFITDHTDMTDTDSLGAEMLSAITKYGGRCAVVYGNSGLEGAKELSEYIKVRSGGTFSLMDALSVENGRHQSARDNAIIYEPTEPYSAEVRDAVGARSVEDVKREIDKYRTTHSTAPIETIGSLEEIEDLDVPEEYKADLRKYYNNPEVHALYNRGDKKIYIFAEKRHRDTNEALLHENVHAVVDELGEGARELMDSFLSQVVKSDFNNGMFRKVLDGVKETYRDDEIAEEFMAFVVSFMENKPKTMKAVMEALDAKTRTELETLIISKIYGSGKGSKEREYGQAKERVDRNTIFQNMGIIERARGRGGIGGRADGEPGGISGEEDTSFRSVPSRHDDKGAGALGMPRNSRGEVLRDEARATAERALEIIERRAAEGAANGMSETEKAELDYMRLYYKRMAAGEDVERTMRGREHHERMVTAARELGEKLGEKVVIHDSADEITDVNKMMEQQKRGSYGWYDRSDGSIHINVGQHGDEAEIVKTVLHETIGHKSIEEIMGADRFRRLIDEVWNHADAKVRTAVSSLMSRHGWDMRKAMKEYLAGLAEEVHTKGYNALEKEQKSLWQRVKAKIQDFINRILEGAKIPSRIKLSEGDLSYMMWKLFKHQERKAAGKPAEGDIFDKAEEAVRRQEWKKAEDGMEIETRDGGNNQTMAERARAVTEQPAIEIETHDYSKEELKRVYANLPSVEKDGRTIRFYNSAFKKIYKEGGLFAKIIPQLHQILEQAHFAYSRPDEYGGQVRPDGTIHKQHPNVRSFDNYVGKVLMDGKKYYVRITVQDNRSSDSGTHSFMATEVEIYEETANGLSLPITTRARGTIDGIVDAKIREFFESAKKYPEYMDDTLPPEDKTGVSLRSAEGYGADKRIEDQVLKMAVDMANRYKNDMSVKDAAIETLGKVIGNLRKAMVAQRTLDYNIARNITEMADVLISSEAFSPTQPGEARRLYNIVRRGLGHTIKDMNGEERVTQSDKDFAEATEALMDLFIDNQLRVTSQFLRDAMKIRGSKVNARGVEVAGKLDVSGQVMMRSMQECMGMSEAAIRDRLGAIEDHIAAGSETASAEKMGVVLALQYATEVTGRKEQERQMKLDLEDLKKQWDPHMSGDARTAYYEQKRALRDSIRQIRCERAEAMRQLGSQIGNEVRYSMERVKAFHEQEKERIEEIRHSANSDMQGRPATESGREGSATDKLSNLVGQTLLAPAATFEQLMRVFGSKSINGEGYLFDRFVRGWQECRDREWMETQRTEGMMDEKASQILGKKNARWSDLYELTTKQAGTCKWIDGGEMVEHELTQGNVMYMYMADKMTDGRVKLRRMGITSTKIEELTQALDPKLKETADWLQEEFLPKLRGKYNEVHERIFGAPMAEIENYFPLKILANARLEEVEIGPSDKNELPKMMTGAIIKRTYNNYALDILHTDAVSVALDHIREMETWAAMAEYRRDLGTLLSYKRFRNQVKNMRTIYGSGEKLWKRLYDLGMLVGGAYKPKTNSFDKAAINLTKMATGACIAIRLNTALKQLLSYPAFAPDASMARLLYNMTPLRWKHCWQWAMENMPAFQRRWKDRQAGNDILRDWDGDWDWTKKDFIKKIQRWGITPNALIDAFTVAIGSEAIYSNKYKQYIKEGYPESKAKAKALQDAEILFNLSQQSSEVMYLSQMQNDRSYLTTCLTVFRNSPMSYLRQSIQSKREIWNMIKNKDSMIEYEVKKGMRDGLTQDQAEARAKRMYRRNWGRNLFKSATFDFVLPALWYYGLTGVWYAIFGKDDEKKKEHAEEALKRGLLGFAEGAVAGGTVPDLVYSWITGGNMKFNEESSPAMGLISDVANYISNGKTERAANEMVNTIVAMGVGVNPQILEDIVVAGMDFCAQDEKSARDWALLAMRVFSCPQSQMDQVYIDELGMSAGDAQRMGPAQLAERYATYKARRSNFATMWAYDNERWEEEVKAPWRKRFEKEAKERLKKFSEAEVNNKLENYDAEYEATAMEIKKITERPGGFERKAAEISVLMDDAEGVRYKLYHEVHPYLDKMVKSWLNAPTAEAAAKEAAAIVEYKAAVVEMLDEWDDREKRRAAGKRAGGIVKDWHKRQGRH